MKLLYFSNAASLLNQIEKRMKASILFAGIALVGFTSCDPLGIDPVTTVDEDKFWENPQLARTFINNFYLWEVTGANQTFQAEQWSDNAIGGNEKDFDTFRQSDFTQRDYDDLDGINCVTIPWADSYKRIRSTNIGLVRIPTVAGLKDDQKNQMLAECYFFRAFQYFELACYWGAAPYVDKPLDVFDMTMIPRTGREDLFDLILADLTEAEKLFDLAGVTPERGMLNKNVVLSIKSRVALYAACAADASKSGMYAKLSGSDETKKLFTFTKDAASYYQIAYQSAGAIVGKYALDSSYENLFNTDKGNTSTESIWPVMFKMSQRDGFNPAAKNGPDSYYYGANEKASPIWNIRGAAFPTQDLVDCYYQQDNKDGVWKQWWKTEQALVDMNGSVDAAGNYKAQTENYEVMYENRDKRFYTTVLHDGSYYGPKDSMHLIATWVDTTDNKTTAAKYSALHTAFRVTLNMSVATGRASAQTITSYYPKKYMQGNAWNNDGTINSNQSTTSYFMIRYAEILLNYAEAAIKLGKEGEAIVKINEIRNRAGLDDFNAAAVGHDIWEEYKIQRRVEFAFEVPSQRYFDLLRWNEAEGNSTITELNQGPKGLLIFKKGMQSELLHENGVALKPGDAGHMVPIIETKRFDYEVFEKKFDEAKYYFIPFQKTTLNSYKGLTQNPGW